MLKQVRDRGLIVHIWTFKDDVLMFNAKTNIVIHYLYSNLIKSDIKY